MTKERPILFNGEMVRAILEGRKTQTRRIIKLVSLYSRAKFKLKSDDLFFFADKISSFNPIKCPYGKVGDKLWVRESFAHIQESECAPLNGFIKDPEILYAATDYAPEPWIKLVEPFRWRPSIYMPRWASRITLEITGVRVERLQDISEADAIAEGVFKKIGRSPIGDVVESANGGQLIYATPTQAREEYKTLWESINGKGSWDKNPYVWVVEFRRIEND